MKKRQRGGGGGSDLEKDKDGWRGDYGEGEGLVVMGKMTKRGKGIMSKDVDGSLEGRYK